jgi:hypothetical protein
MEYSIFAKKAKEQDNSNIFSKCSNIIDIIPDELIPFYQEYNPVDVEITYDGVGIHFYPIDELSDLQAEYAYIKAQFVFATCNSDPIFLNNEKVYTCPHGVKEPEWEKLAESFEEYLSLLLS